MLITKKKNMLSCDVYFRNCVFLAGTKKHAK